MAGVALGAGGIALIGFVGSYTAVATLAERKGFGAFAAVFPIGLDAGILVLLALDLLLTWLRMTLPMLRHIAWLLTAATIAFNAAAAWPDPIGVGMHGVIPILFVAVVEAARHAIGVAANLTASKHMEGVRLSRWLLAPWSTFLLWRRMKLWELRSYDAVIKLERERMIERARLRRRYGPRWRSKAPIEAVLALRLTRYGRPLSPVEGALDVSALKVGYGGAPIDIEGAPLLDPAPKRPALAPHPAPERPAPHPEGAPGKGAPNLERPAPESGGAPHGDAPSPVDEPALDEPAPDRPEPEGCDEGDAPTDEPQAATRDDAKRKILALWHDLGERPKEGRIVEVLEGLDRYPYTSRRHAQKLRDEVEADERKRLEREAPNVRPLTGT